MRTISVLVLAMAMMIEIPLDLSLGKLRAAIFPPIQLSTTIVEPVDTLLDVLCKAESGGEPVPAWAVGRPYGSDWGECQVKYWSAIHFGGFDEQMRRTGKPSRNPGELFTSQINRRIAWNILHTCRIWYPRGSDERHAYCYHAGPRAKYHSDRSATVYARNAIKQLKTRRTE